MNSASGHFYGNTDLIVCVKSAGDGKAVGFAKKHGIDAAPETERKLHIFCEVFFIKALYFFTH